jgi:D-3-phosphoglycerate dehydrogenase / 2-oxoglutarate reductase
MFAADLPRLFFDRAFPLEYADLMRGRANAVGPDDADLAGADGIIAGATRPWNAAAFALAPQVRVISRTGIGYDNVDVVAANAAGVAVCYAPDAPSVSTAEHALALILAVAKGLPAHQARAVEGLAGGPAAGLELDGRTLGLVGLGRIARRVAVVGVALGMHVVAHDPLVQESGIQGVTMVGLEELFHASDVVSLHAPALPETHHLIGTDNLGRMKRGSYLVNCARGSLVDQAALIVALDSGHLAGAALDVTDPEPLPVGHPLLTHPAVIVTPHVASSTGAGRRRLYQQGIENALAVLRGDAATLVPSSIQP